MVDQGPEGFCRALWGESSGFAELRLIGPKGKSIQKFFRYPEQLDGFLQAAQEANGVLNVYFGVCLRDKESGKTADVPAAPCVWVDIDWKNTPREKAIEALKQFPLRPSIGIQSGAGFHVYWLLHEPTTDLPKVARLNHALAAAVGGDPKSTDVARILRIPNTLNVKYDPPKECMIVTWGPDRRYSLDDFSFLPDEEPAQNPAPETTPGPLEQYELPDELTKKLVNYAQQMWIPGHRHTVALFLSGMLLKSGITAQATKNFIEAVCLITRDEEKVDRLRAVDESLRKIQQDPDKVGGSLRLEKDVIDLLPAALRPPAKKALEIIQNSLRGLKRDEQTVSGDIQIVRITKFDSRPPLWEARVLYGGQEYDLRCDSKTLLSPNAFFDAFWDEHTLTPMVAPRIDRWKKMLNEAPKQVHKIDSIESTSAGYVQQILEDYEAKAQDDRIGDLALQAVPVRTDSGELLIRLPSFMAYLRREGVEGRSRQEVLSVLKCAQYSPEKRRVGKIQVRVWVKVPPSVPPASSPQPESNGHSKEMGLL